MPKEKLEKYRTLGFWLLLLTFLSFWPFVLIALEAIETITSFNDFFNYSLTNDGFSFFVFVVYIFLSLDFFLSLPLLIFRLFGVFKRKRLWIVISLFAIPVSILNIMIRKLDFGLSSEFFWSSLNAFIFSFYLYFSKRAKIYFMPENEYRSLINETPIEQTRLSYMNDSDKFA